MLLSYVVVLASVILFADAGEVGLRKGSGEKLEKARSIVENIKSLLASNTHTFLKEDSEETESDFPAWAYWAIGGGIVLLSLLSYVIYRYVTWVPKKRVKTNSNGGTSSENESSRLIADAH